MGGHVRTQKVSVSEGHSPPGERRTDRQVWIVERIQGSEGHSQHRTDGQVSGVERIRGSEGHLLTGEPRMDGQVRMHKEPEERGALTPWRVQTDGQVRTWKGSEGARGTHSTGRMDKSAAWKESEGVRGTYLLESPGRTDKSGHIKNPRSEGHSRPGECRRMDKSGLGKNPGERGALMS